MAQRLLIVDDEAGVRFFERVTFEEHGYEVDEAADGPQALSACAAAGGTYAAIVLDFRMPQMTGLEVAETLRDRGDATPILLYSGYIDQDVAARAAQLGLKALDKSEIEALVSAVQGLTAAEPGPPA